MLREQAQLQVEVRPLGRRGGHAVLAGQDEGRFTASLWRCALLQKSVRNGNRHPRRTVHAAELRRRAVTAPIAARPHPVKGGAAPLRPQRSPDAGRIPAEVQAVDPVHRDRRAHARPVRRASYRDPCPPHHRRRRPHHHDQPGRVGRDLRRRRRSAGRPGPADDARRRDRDGHARPGEHRQPGRVDLLDHRRRLVGRLGHHRRVRRRLHRRPDVRPHRADDRRLPRPDDLGVHHARGPLSADDHGRQPGRRRLQRRRQRCWRRRPDGRAVGGADARRGQPARCDRASGARYRHRPGGPQ